MSRRRRMKRYQFPQEFPADFPKLGQDGKIPNSVLVEYLLHQAEKVVPLGDAGDGIWRGIVHYGPKTADRFLNGPNKDNRDMHYPAARQMVEDMRNGSFKNATSDAIIVSWDGKVLNGQHRSVAVIESGATIIFEVHIGVDPTANLHIDQGTRRTVKDGLHYEKAECSFGRSKAVSRSRAYDTIALESKVAGSNEQQTHTVVGRLPLMEKVNSAVTRVDGNGASLPPNEQPCRHAGSHAAFMLGYELFPGVMPRIARVLGSGEYTQNSPYGMFHQYIINMSQGKPRAGGVQSQESFDATVGLICCVVNNSTPTSRAAIKANATQLKNFRFGKSLVRKKSDRDYAPSAAR